jgi:hypothetical protein
VRLHRRQGESHLPRHGHHLDGALSERILKSFDLAR